MKKIFLIAVISVLATQILIAQGPNRAFGKFKKLKDHSEINCSDNCATLLIAYPKGTYINNVKAALCIDEKYAIATEKGSFIEVKIPAGKHKITLAQGVSDGVRHEMEECESQYENFVAFCSNYANVEKYKIHIASDNSELNINLYNLTFTNKMFVPQMDYLSYSRDFKAGANYYFTTFVIGKGVSLSCGPILQETTQEEFELITGGKKIKGESEALYYKLPE